MVVESAERGGGVPGTFAEGAHRGRNEDAADEGGVEEDREAGASPNSWMKLTWPVAKEKKLTASRTAAVDTMRPVFARP